MPEQVLLAAVALIAAFVMTGLARRYAVRSRLLDIPNDRSSHAEPTPRGGGIAVLGVVSCGLLLLLALGEIEVPMVVAIIPATLAVGIAGFVDDRGGLSPGIRIAVHVSSAALYLFVAGGPPQLGIHWLDMHPVLAFGVTLFGLVWFLNLFNFMDGIDGIAATQAICVATGLALVAYLSGDAAGALWFALLLGGACLGFLIWNWPPAKIFMGDVGSGFIGLALGMLSLQTVRECGIPIGVPLILIAAFASDATLTLVVRALRGERVYSAHRTHAYQWLSRRWGSHRRVVLGLIGINLLWLLPLALLAARFPQHSWLIAIVAYIPLVAFTWWAGAGRPESNRESAA